MLLSISNIAWPLNSDEYMYNYLNSIGFTGLEVAPTRIFPKDPYNDLETAKSFSQNLKKQYNLDISSIQSILYGKSECLFATNEERNILLDYTKKAIDFAVVIGCKNIVFGCPKNRIMNSEDQYQIAVEFFKELGNYALKKGTVISIEPNPVIYGTNFINYTSQAFDLVKSVNCDSFKVNVDFGTILYNNESLSIIDSNLSHVNHIHISEPNLMLIKKRKLHIELADILKCQGYSKFVSIEMKNLNDLEAIKTIVLYIKEVFA